KCTQKKLRERPALSGSREFNIWTVRHSERVEGITGRHRIVSEKKLSSTLTRRNRTVAQPQDSGLLQAKGFTQDCDLKGKPSSNA
ncbi:MAG: hypothetical protein ABJ360_10240, partial [Roseobacter sp.]